ncbi:MAG TPA: glycogen/starch synthase [Candidatus Limnocylindrales bacterium]|nr:glycogen/starch synthase [Candidatus Limnocylindrales bacterium]
MSAPLHVAFVWHMHQPYYLDDVTNTFLLPWVRLRSAKDYYRMAAILEAYPTVVQTFNLVPSLCEQIEAYEKPGTSDVYLDLTRRPSADLTAEERAFVVRWFTDSSRIRRVRRYPRFLELVLRREQSAARSQTELAALLTDAELRDLQVWFNLSWIDPTVLADDAAVRDLLRRGRDFSEADKEPVIAAQFEAMRKVLPAYRALRERGQAELTTSPYFHPIMPLVCDLQTARAAVPTIALPHQPFAHPEDAAEQVAGAVESYRRLFGAAPGGLWPPELAIGDELPSIAQDHGLRWSIGDEGVLNRSRDGAAARDGDQVRHPDLLYRPYRYERDGKAVDLVFRDARLSNLIGFEYQNQPAQEAVSDLLARLHAIRDRQRPGDPPQLVTIALDGENCWDFYEEDGNRFLSELYGRLSADTGLRLTTPGAFLDSNPERHSIDHVVPGSWINASLDTWIGDPEHSRAWELLGAAREAVAKTADELGVDAVASARREALIAEGSDWFWWFGRRHDSGMDVVWDNLFRLHLRNVYGRLGRRPPMALFRPVIEDGSAPALKRPERTITPRLDGAIDEAAWLAGGYVDPTALYGAMHPPRGRVRRLWYGHDDRYLYLRFDLLGPVDSKAPLSLRVFFSGTPSGAEPGGAGWRPLEPATTQDRLGFEPAAVLTAQLGPDSATAELRQLRKGQQAPAPTWRGQPGGSNPVQLAVPFAALGHEPGETLEMVAVVASGPQIVEQLPPTGAITVRVPGDGLEARPRPLKILLVAAEVAPFAKVGGLADVAGALPKALRQLGHDVRVVMPRYGSIDVERYGLREVVKDLPVPLAQQTINATVLEGRIGQDVPVYFIDNAQFFAREGMYGLWDDDARFIYFSRAALEMLRPLGFKPDVVHVNDWHTAVIPNMLVKLYDRDPFYADMATVLTIHNLAFQGVFGYGTLHLADLDPWGLITPGIAGLDEIVNLLGRGVYFSDVVNTVSNRYAQEILTPEYGEHMDPLLRVYKSKLHGIINGIDYEVFNPETDPNIAARYTLETVEQKVQNKLALQREVGLPEDARVPVIGLISRLYDQKGLDLIANIMWGLMRLRLQLVVLGAGDQRYEEMFRATARDHPDKVSATIGFKPILAQHIYAGSDMFLMPSRFEPCGLGQLISLRYGTIPIVRATGGLADTIADVDPAAQTGNGFVFEAYDHWDLYAQVVRALEAFRQPALWRRLQANAMRSDVSWTNSAQQYAALYRTAIRHHLEAREYAAPALTW